MFQGSRVKRTAKANSIAKHNTTRSKHIKNTALTRRGKLAKYFKIKLVYTIFNGSMWDYVDVILKIFYEDTFLRTFVCEFLRTIVFDILGTAPELIRGGGK